MTRRIGGVTEAMARLMRDMLAGQPVERIYWNALGEKTPGCNYRQGAYTWKCDGRAVTNLVHRMFIDGFAICTPDGTALLTPLGRARCEGFRARERGGFRSKSREARLALPAVGIP